MRVVALGRTRLLYQTIRALVHAGHTVPAIITCKAAPEYDIREADFAALASELGSEFLLTQNINSEESLSVLRRANGSIGVSVNWISLVGKKACEALPMGILNAHAGDLPRYRGNAPVAWAILQGEPRVGVTVHEMAPDDLDAGAVICTDYFPLSESTYIGDVYSFLERRIPELFVEAVSGLNSGAIIPRPQSTEPSASLRCYPRAPEDGRINWNSATETIARLVRASSEPFSGAFTTFRDERLVIWRAKAGQWPSPSLAVAGQVVSRNAQSGEVGIATADGVLTLQEIELGDSGRCRPDAIIKSLRDRLGLSGMR